MAGPEYKNAIAGPKPAPRFQMPANKRQHRAGANRQNGARNRGNAIGHDLIGTGPQVFHHRRLGHEHRDGTGDEKGRYQAQQHMFLGVPLCQCQRFDHRPGKAAAVYGQPEKDQKNRCNDSSVVSRLSSSPPGFRVVLPQLSVQSLSDSDCFMPNPLLQ